jgi:hypothetical protein
VIELWPIHSLIWFGSVILSAEIQIDPQEWRHSCGVIGRSPAASQASRAVFLTVVGEKGSSPSPKTSAPGSPRRPVRSRCGPSSSANGAKDRHGALAGVGLGAFQFALDVVPHALHVQLVRLDVDVAYPERASLAAPQAGVEEARPQRPLLLGQRRDQALGLVGPGDPLPPAGRFRQLDPGERVDRDLVAVAGDAEDHAQRVECVRDGARVPAISP